MKALIYFLPLFRRLGSPMLVSLLLSLITLAAGIGLLGISGWFLTAAALSTAGSAFNLFGPSAGVRGISFTRILSRYGEKLTGHDATLRLLSDLRRWLFGRLFRIAPLGRIFGRADLVSRLVADLDALDTMFLVALGPITTSALAGIPMSVLLGLTLPAAMPFYVAGSAIAVFVVPTGLVLWSRAAGVRAVAASAALRQAVLEGIDGHRDLVLFGALDRVVDRSSEAAQELGRARLRAALLGSLASALVQMIAGANLLATLVCGLSAIRAGTIDSAVFVGLLLAVIASFEASAILVRSASRLAGSAAAAERLVVIAEADPAVSVAPNPVTLPPGGTLSFENVGFGYKGRADVFDGVTFCVTSGDCVAIRGPSGAGKSTLAQLAVRLIDPPQGTVSINGVDLREADVSDLRSRIALMTQDAPVFGDTVRANLQIGRPDATDGQLWETLDSVKLGDTIRALPRGLDAILGEAGGTLSAGQARRICLARTLLSPAGIIVLDEPTSGLDPEAEAQFMIDLPRLADGRTMLVITHAVVPADFSRVLALRGGRLCA
jgi:ATP-binding cassette subfamily C protein CydC